MKVKYDKYYQTENLFGEPYPELIEFYSKVEQKGKLLDLGCGQGRDSIALAKLGYQVIGIDHSTVGIQQLNEIARREQLSMKGIVGDIFEYANFEEFEFILLDSMFHFRKAEIEKETNLLHRIFKQSMPNTRITICIQDSGKKVEILLTIIAETTNIQHLDQQSLLYQYMDNETSHSSKTKYRMITVKIK